MKYTFGIVHRYMGSSKTDWYADLARLLEADGHKVIIPDLPGADRPSAAVWLPILEEAFRGSENFVLIGHSLGTRAALLYIEKYSVKTELLLLVGALSNDTDNAVRLGGKVADFYEYKVDPDSINSLVKKIILMHSKDDPSVSYEDQGKALAEELDAELLTYEDKGHFHEPSDSKEIYKVLKERLDL